MTGVDPQQEPQRARQRLLEMLPMDVGSAPASNDPVDALPENELSGVTADGARVVRWGAGHTWHWDWGKRFTSMEDVLSYEPMDHMDQRGAGVVAEYDYSLSVDELAQQLQNTLDTNRSVTDHRALVTAGFYNTVFMWPLLTFGWELFLELGMAYQEDAKRLINRFAERSRKIFRALAKTDVEMVTSHDDICYTRGPVFNPAWLREMIYPYYEEFWGYLRAAGIKVVFISDGNMDDVADDIFACGADGIRSEPYTNWETIARNHPDKVLVGDGDNRIVSSGNREAIYEMVRKMTAMGRQYPGYFYCVGNHLPWNLPVEGIAAYFDASAELGHR